MYFKERMKLDILLWNSILLYSIFRYIFHDSTFWFAGPLHPWNSRQQSHIYHRLRVPKQSPKSNNLRNKDSVCETEVQTSLLLQEELQTTIFTQYVVQHGYHSNTEQQTQTVDWKLQCIIPLVHQFLKRRKKYSWISAGLESQQ